MSKQEAKRLTVIEQVLIKELTQKRAAELLGLSLPRIKTLCRVVREGGAEAIVHGNVGRPPPNTIKAEIREYIVTCYKKHYHDFNFTHFTEKLKEVHQIAVSRPTVYRILHEAGVSSSRTQRRPTRHHRRQPKAREGELVQLDASQHDWFEDGAHCHLHGAIDDATSRVLGLYFAPEELTDAYFHLFWQINASGGVPLALYTDGRSVFTNNRSEDKLSIAQQLAGVDPHETQFSRAMGQLGVRIIIATSAEAKGRVERLWGTLQDRLVKELRLAGIRSIDEANSWLPSFIKTHNVRFARKPRELPSAFRPKVRSNELELVLCRQEPRKLDRGLAFSYHNRIFVLPERHKGKLLIARASQTVTVLDNPRFGIKAQLMVGNEQVIVAPKEIGKQPRLVASKQKSSMTPEQHLAYCKIGAANSPWSKFKKVTDSQQLG